MNIFFVILMLAEVFSAAVMLQIDVHKEALTPQNALSLISQYDIVLDCTDNAPTRYLISDACVVSHKPLVSGAAIGTDGQLTVYSYGDDGKNSLHLHWQQWVIS